LSPFSSPKIQCQGLNATARVSRKMKDACTIAVQLAIVRTPQRGNMGRETNGSYRKSRVEESRTVRAQTATRWFVHWWGSYRQGCLLGCGGASEKISKLSCAGPNIVQLLLYREPLCKIQTENYRRCAFCASNAFGQRDLNAVLQTRFLYMNVSVFLC
jgi:hypothetical protein